MNIRMLNLYLSILLTNLTGVLVSVLRVKCVMKPLQHISKGYILQCGQFIMRQMNSPAKQILYLENQTVIITPSNQF